MLLPLNELNDPPTFPPQHKCMCIPYTGSATTVLTILSSDFKCCHTLPIPKALVQLWLIEIVSSCRERERARQLNDVLRSQTAISGRHINSAFLRRGRKKATREGERGGGVQEEIASLGQRGEEREIFLAYQVGNLMVPSTALRKTHRK